jgi:Holliday junction resolvasome RuvABC endonuclease subunit
VARITGANDVTTILGIDASSVTIGYALLVDGAIERYGHYDIAKTSDIARRCELARVWTIGALATFQPSLVLIESPVGRHAKAVIPQARVSGAILCALDAAQALYAEVTPGQGKMALAKNGAASKFAMLASAGSLLSISGHARTVKGKVCLCATNGKPILTEDEADAIGIALHGLTVRVKVAA